MDSGSIIIALTSLLAATVTGALGYGYSSITVPIALLVTTSRRLNPALVIIETAVNLYVLFLRRHAIRRVWPLVAPIVTGILPGVAIGSLVLASISPEWAKLVTYTTLLPLILIQTAGIRIPIRNARVVGYPYGAGVGVLFSLTTISGPPLALYFNNLGMSRDDLKVALAIARSVESGATMIAYLSLGLITRDSIGLAGYLAPGVLVGLPLGFVVIRHIEPELFRRMCMSFDAWLVGFGLSRVVNQLELMPTVWAYQVLTLTMLADAFLLRTFFRSRRPGERPVRIAWRAPDTEPPRSERARRPTSG